MCIISIHYYQTHNSIVIFYFLFNDNQFGSTFIQIYPVSEGYLRKIPVERRGKWIYLFNSAEYLTANKTVACKQVQNFRPPRSFDFQLRRDVINYLKKGFRLERDIFL